jgi:cyclic pyranopterin phosphate synthase
MPAEGIDLAQRSALLSFEEYLELIGQAVELGVKKIRITGGEPFVRKDIQTLLKGISKIQGLDSWHITTNGVLLKPHLAMLKDLGIGSVNLSLDSLQPERFAKITRRNQFDRVWESLEGLLEMGISTKLNVVVMSEFNADEILDFANLTLEKNLEVRFIEEMPFNGGSDKASVKFLNLTGIEQILKSGIPDLINVGRAPKDTTVKFKIPNSKGGIGIIPAYTRTICGDCNRIRFTAKGELKNCLYDGGVFDFKTLLRDSSMSDLERRIKIKSELQRLVWKKPKNGFVAERNLETENRGNFLQSMSHIGG